jgi:hypothetical protein
MKIIKKHLVAFIILAMFVAFVVWVIITGENVGDFYKNYRNGENLKTINQKVEW